MTSTTHIRPLPRMFVKTEIGRRGDVIRVERNKRDPNEPNMAVAHLIVDNAGSSRHTEFETDRRKFLGRGRTLSEAAAFDPGATLSGTDGFTLDPVLSLRRTVRVPPGKKVSVIFWTIAAPSRNEVDKAVDRYRHADAFNHELVQAWTRTQVQMRHVGVTSQQAAAFQHLGRYLVYPDMYLRADAAAVARRHAVAVVALAAGDFGRFPDLHPAQSTMTWISTLSERRCLRRNTCARAASPPIWSS